MSTHYDVIIIGTGPGRGTLIYKLAPSGKKILLLEGGVVACPARKTTGTLKPFSSTTNIRQRKYGKIMMGAHFIPASGPATQPPSRARIPSSDYLLVAQSASGVLGMAHVARRRDATSGIQFCADVSGARRPVCRALSVMERVRTIGPMIGAMSRRN